MSQYLVIRSDGSTFGNPHTRKRHAVGAAVEGFLDGSLPVGECVGIIKRKEGCTDATRGTVACPEAGTFKIGLVKDEAQPVAAPAAETPVATADTDAE